ncbi:MAG: MerR family transcriptional regulator [Alphaproteobacteria bacterium]|nr:MerR family transcriptional regulator [Alphaproteobacteria bacterium]
MSQDHLLKAKAPEAFRTISEVSGDLGVPQHVLRFWEGKFTAIKPMKRGGGRRYYRPDEIELLRGIHFLLHSEGYTIKGVQKILKERGLSYVVGCWKEGDDCDREVEESELVVPSSIEEVKQACEDICSGEDTGPVSVFLPCAGSNIGAKETVSSRESRLPDALLTDLRQVLISLQETRAFLDQG